MLLIDFRRQKGEKENHRTGENYRESAGKKKRMPTGTTP